MLINSSTDPPAHPPTKTTTLDDERPHSRGAKSLFSKYERVKDPIVSQFISSIPDSFPDAIDRMLEIINNNTSSYSLPPPVNDSILNNRVKLQEAISKFHSEAGTMTKAVSNSIVLLKDPSTKLFVSIHQPNLFAYSGVFKKIVLLQTLKNEVEKKENQREEGRGEKMEQRGAGWGG